MAKKDDLRQSRINTVINSNSSKQEKTLILALRRVEEKLRSEFPTIDLVHEKRLYLHKIVSNLTQSFPRVEFRCSSQKTYMCPDGGILSIRDKNGKTHPILISEKKNQGTNDVRLIEGKSKQAKGNAIERLGKNVIGFRTAFKGESIFPFVCFGDGCDFDEHSSILDRVVTIAQFGLLNTQHLHKQGNHNEFDRGSFYFRVAEWTEDEMAELAGDIAIKSVYHYFSKYGKESFI